MKPVIEPRQHSPNGTMLSLTLRDVFRLVVSLQGEIVDIACYPLYENAAISRCCFMLRRINAEAGAMMYLSRFFYEIRQFQS